MISSCFKRKDDADDARCGVLAVFENLNEAVAYASLHVAELECLTGKDEVQQRRVNSKEAGEGTAYEEASDWMATKEESDNNGSIAWDVHWQHRTRIEVSRQIVHRRTLDAPARGLHHYLSDPWGFS